MIKPSYQVTRSARRILKDGARQMKRFAAPAENQVAIAKALAENPPTADESKREEADDEETPRVRGFYVMAQYL